eukprot:symbB.v1.2.040353.t1/scaffold7166.1/size12945/1
MDCYPGDVFVIEVKGVVPDGCGPGKLIYVNLPRKGFSVVTCRPASAIEKRRVTLWSYHGAPRHSCPARVVGESRKAAHPWSTDDDESDDGGLCFSPILIEADENSDEEGVSWSPCSAKLVAQESPDTEESTAWESDEEAKPTGQADVVSLWMAEIAVAMMGLGDMDHVVAEALTSEAGRIVS